MDVPIDYWMDVLLSSYNIQHSWTRGSLDCLRGNVVVGFRVASCIATAFVVEIRVVVSDRALEHEDTLLTTLHISYSSHTPVSQQPSL